MVHHREHYIKSYFSTNLIFSTTFRDPNDRQSKISKLKSAWKHHAIKICSKAKKKANKTQNNGKSTAQLLKQQSHIEKNNVFTA